MQNGQHISQKMFDISIPLTSKTPVWPGDPPVVISPITRITSGDEYNLSQLSLSCHAGTHVDAPWHFDNNGRQLQDIPLDIWIGLCYVANCVTNSHIINRDDLERASIPSETTRLLLRTDSVVSHHHFSEQFAGLTENAATWIIAQGIQLVGIDTPSIEPFNSPGDPVHHLLLRNNIPIIESLDLRDISAGWYQLVCLPLKLAGVDAAPARVLLLEKA